MHHIVAALELETFMREALTEAEAAGHAGEYPIGAVVVIDGEIVSRGRSRQLELTSQLGHAELDALQRGGKRLVGGVLRSESRALVARFKPELIPYLDDQVVRHRQREPPI